MSVLTYIRSDLHRYAGRTDFATMARQYLRNRSFRFCFWFRLAKARNPLIQLPARIMLDRVSKRFGIQIPRRTEIGYGLYIGHHMGVVVHPRTKIGDNCNIQQFVTIGSNRNTPATIGNGVWIGPGVCIVESVTVGDYAQIGAGAVVVKDVPANTTVAGNPARVITERGRDPALPDFWLGA